MDEEEKQKLTKFMIGRQQVDNYLELVTYAARQRFGTLSTVSTLAATLLVVATFNQNLIPIDNFVRGLLAGLLLLILISIWGSLLGLNKAEEHGVKMVKQITKDTLGVDISERVEEIRKPSILGYLPLALTVALTIIIGMIILLVLNFPLKGLLINLWKLYF